ncbi:nodulation protein L [Verticillium alfalfae VaMs.102]|uniref:Nodulation protein L n=1 Tax=Verticillium alfalfae (strain VaMs.102 / ATCC MYA-4576 / FGSC 10136) TaxID=526221 RepID=C9SZ51_VERA1|nr:nodulation protein L [Verticillium alfalfae VaMs.102]EEY24066.1 nodulation protein L [Verticillium alfalfae VaMs.102]KAH6699571.1 nodulation protein L [Verticillium dahliae]
MSHEHGSQPSPAQASSSTERAKNIEAGKEYQDVSTAPESTQTAPDIAFQSAFTCRTSLPAQNARRHPHVFQSSTIQQPLACPDSWPSERDLREIGIEDEEINGDWIGHDFPLPTATLPYAGESVYCEGEQKLIDDCTRCTLACQKFNSVMECVSGVVPTTLVQPIQQFLYGQIIFPSSGGLSNATNRDARHRVPSFTVEAPFHCRYGYNITIGEHVTIGQRCYFDDGARVTIGANSTIARGVQIITTDDPGQCDRRLGVHRLAKSRPVIIESSCSIGAGVLICPGVRIGAGSIVLPGTIVTSVVSLLEEIRSLIDCLQDIAPAALAFGNPQQSAGVPPQVPEAPC